MYLTRHENTDITGLSQKRAFIAGHGNASGNNGGKLDFLVKMGIEMDVSPFKIGIGVIDLGGMVTLEKNVSHTAALSFCYLQTVYSILFEKAISVTKKATIALKAALEYVSMVKNEKELFL